MPYPLNEKRNRLLYSYLKTKDLFSYGNLTESFRVVKWKSKVNEELSRQLQKRCYKRQVNVLEKLYGGFFNRLST